MNLQEKLNVDKQTVPRAMVFFVEGKFYTGYERTAYLASRLLPPLKVNCRYRKSVEQAVAMVGFPASSLPKFTDSFTMEQHDDTLLLTVPPNTPYSDEDFEAWTILTPPPTPPLHGRGAATTLLATDSSVRMALPSLVGEGQGWGQ